MPFDLSPQQLALLALPLLLLIAYWLLRGNGYDYAGKPILTDNELGFYHTLRTAFAEDDIVVLPQVAMNAFIKPGSGETGKRYAAARATFAQKHVDFLLCTADTLEILAIVELDDRSHSLERDLARDAITRSAGYPTLRFHSRRKPDIDELRDYLDKALKGKARTLRAY
ncbi:MAG: DUF2726 domain-containing protein [Azonexus sp.]|nr:DUF2726 domain-containing protein [Azonexus sp.]MCK6412882.1 DUF2726 domain-containing protein [Azonexus sp.]